MRLCEYYRMHANAAILIRLAAGAVFLSEGIQKFLDPAALGAGRFERIGIPQAQLMGPFVGGVEIACGALLLLVAMLMCFLYLALADGGRWSLDEWRRRRKSE
ncbi:MAG TPA: DoxX family protein [Thermoanaerobaculia bacterium]|nr:DoxX family protein [Thermoanaerobaculia bacterium]